ncbi:MAG: DMT family transporter [Natronospirillum sp.]
MNAPKSSHTGTLRSDVWLVLVTLLAAFGWVFSKEALAGMTPLLFLGARFLGAGVVLALLGWPALYRLTGEQWRRALMTGVVMGAAMSCWIMGLNLAENIGIGAFLTSLGVVFIPIVGKLLFGAVTARSTWVAVGVALVGLALLRIEGGFTLSASDGFFLLAALVFSLHFNLTSRYAARIPALPLTAVQLAMTGFFALLLSGLFETGQSMPELDILGWLLASLLIATCLRFWLQFKAQGLAPVSHAAVIMTLEPVWTSLLGLLWFSQTLSAVQLLGCGLIFSALLISRWRVLLRRPLPPVVS